MSNALILELILALVTLGLKYKDAKNISDEEINEALDEARKKFYARDPANLPEI